jgi:hypothetical protein
MSDRHGVLRGLRDQECEKGVLVKRPPIPYVPVVDEVQDVIALNNSGNNTEKLKMPNGTTISARVRISGTPEQFLNHVKNTLNYIKHKGLFNDNMTAYKKALEARKKANAALMSAASAKKEGVSNDVIKGYKKQVKLFQTEAAKAAAGAKAAEGIFSLYSNLLSVEQRIYWDNIVEKQIGMTPWFGP